MTLNKEITYAKNSCKPTALKRGEKIDWDAVKFYSAVIEIAVSNVQTNKL